MDILELMTLLPRGDIFLLSIIIPTEFIFRSKQLMPNDLQIRCSAMLWNVPIAFALCSTLTFSTRVRRNDDAMKYKCWYHKNKELKTQNQQLQKCQPMIATSVINNKLNILIGNKYFHSKFNN